MKTSCYRLLTLGFLLLAFGVSLPAAASNDYTSLSINGTHPNTDSTQTWGSGWYYYWDRDGTTIYLKSTGPYEISGTDIAAARISVQHDCEITINSLQINNETVDYSPFECNGHTVTLKLRGASAFNGGWHSYGEAAVNVTPGSTLNITNLESSASLSATGQGRAAGIGGSYQQGCGTVNVYGGTVTATGNSYDGDGAAGLGGGYQGAGGTVNVYGGTVTATGGNDGAGIGGGNGGNGGTVNISGGNVTANGGTWNTSGGAGIGGGSAGAGGSVTVSGGTVIATGGYACAGVGGGDCKSGGTCVLSGGNVSATGGYKAAGVGGGYNGSGGTVTISGGTVNATGGTYGAGVGGGNHYDAGDGGIVTITGGDVFANGGSDGAGIGGGDNGGGGAISISGGFVYATRGGSDTAQDVGHGDDSSDGTLTFTGGSIRCCTSTSLAAPQPRNAASTPVYAVAFAGFGNHVAVTSIVDDAGSPVAYGLHDVHTDQSTAGTVWFWLPAGPKWVTVNGIRLWCAPGFYPDASPTIQGLAVNGTSVLALNSPPGTPSWSYSAQKLDLMSDGSFTIAGSDTNTTIRTFHDCTVVASNLVIRNDEDSSFPAFDCRDSAVTFLLAGRNILVGGGAGDGQAGIRVNSAASLLISNVTAGASLCATGMISSAAIGGNCYETNGLIRIAGGIIAAYNTGALSDTAAGIGGGYEGGGGTIIIDGGAVTAVGGQNSPAIGPGGTSANSTSDPGCTVIIRGGDVTATGAAGCAGIGGCTQSGAVTILITGGTITATGGEQGAGIGSGLRSGGTQAHTQITITGGTVTAIGGDYGAGIGGGWDNNNLDISISGGTVIAHGGYGGAGIGTAARSINLASEYVPQCVIAISGGRITAMGGDIKKYQGGAGIGGGSYSYADVTISGGTIVATRGLIDTGTPFPGGDIGWGGCPSGSYTAAEIAAIKSSGKAVFTGGSIHATQGLVFNPPVWYGKTLFCVPVTGLAPNAAISLTPASESLSYYGTKDIYSDAAGTVYLWLPPGDFLLAPSPAAAGSASAANLSTIAVKSDSTFTIGSTPVRITGFDGSSVTNWLPTALSPSHAETLYATNLTAAASEWKRTNDFSNVGTDTFTNFISAPAVFMKLHVR